MNIHEKKLILKKDSNLYLDYDIYNGKDELIHKQDILKTPLRPYYLYDLPFSFEDGVTILNLCDYLKKDLDYWEIIIGNLVSEYVKTCYIEPHKNPFSDEATLIKTILTWNFECKKYKGKKELSNPTVNFGMIGKSKDGDVNYGFGDIYLSDIKDLPIEMDLNAKLYYVNLDYFIFNCKKDFDFKKNIFQKMFPLIDKWFFRLEMYLKHKTYDFGTMEMSMFDVFYGIFWELSFYGSPSDRTNFFKELDKRSQEYENSKEFEDEEH